MNYIYIYISSYFDNGFVTAFGLHLTVDSVQPRRSHFDVRRTYVAGVPKIRGCSDHGPIDTHSRDVPFALNTQKHVARVRTPVESRTDRVRRHVIRTDADKGTIIILAVRRAST